MRGSGRGPTAFPDFVRDWNAAQGLATPGLHARIAAWLDARWRGGDRRLLLLAFRNSGKSTLLGLFAAWLLYDDPARRILTLSADLALAKKLARNTKRIIERHPLTGHLRPARADQWAAEQFTVARAAELRDPSMLARGIGGNVTGSHADIVICDDVEVPRTSDTAPKREELRERLAEIDYVLSPGGLQLYAGTPHSYYTIYAEAPRPDLGEAEPFLAGFARLEIPLLNAAGTSAWPERFPPDAIAAIRRRQGPNRFASQMLLQPVSATQGRLDPDLLIPYEAELAYREANGRAALFLDGRRLTEARAWWDPAFGAPGTGDASVVAAVFRDAIGEWWLHDLRYLRHDRRQPDAEAVQQCHRVVAFAAELHLPWIGVEINGVGRFLPGLLRSALRTAGVACTVVESASTVAKDRRILEAFEALLHAGALRAHRRVLATPFAVEMREWRPGGRGRDDGLDAVAGALLAGPQQGPLPPALPRRPDWRPGAGQFLADTRFAV